MSVNELIEKLKKLPAHHRVMVKDVVGCRELLGPYEYEITEEDSNDHADCENREGEWIVVL